jgi:hypothetical protein
MFEKFIRQRKARKFITIAERWAQKKEKKCIDCGTTKRPYHCKGRCQRCNSKWRYANDPDYRAKHKKLVYRWIKAHPERWKELVTKAINKWRAKHPEQAKEIARQNYQKNANKKRARSRLNYEKRKYEEENNPSKKVQVLRMRKAGGVLVAAN